MKNGARLALIFIPVFWLLVAPAAAQTPTPPQPTPAPRGVVVTGAVVNRTEGGSVPTSLDLVLHAWDQDFTEKLMLNGQSNSDGAFRFENVPVEPGLLYGVMATHNGVSYFSEPVMAKAGQALPAIEVPVYETTTDSAQVQIERAHVLFFYSNAGLEVGEIYSLSNLGNRAVKDATALDDGTFATFKFPLPAEATNVTFESNDDRFVRTPNGFAYTAPLAPGANSGQIMVRYVLPYRSGMTYTYIAQVPTQGINYLVADDSGLTVAGDGLTDAGVQPMGEGLNFAVLTHGTLQPGEKSTVTLSGQPQVSALAHPKAQESAATNSRLPNSIIVIGGILLGLALVAFGVWWFRRPYPAVAEAPVESNFEDLLMEIAMLDEAHARGEVDEETHTARRASLFQEARSLIEKRDHR